MCRRDFTAQKGQHVRHALLLRQGNSSQPQTRGCREPLPKPKVAPKLFLEKTLPHSAVLLLAANDLWHEKHLSQTAAFCEQPDACHKRIGSSRGQLLAPHSWHAVGMHGPDAAENKAEPAVT